MAARIYDPFAADYQPPEEAGTPGLSLAAPAATATAPKIYDPFAADYEPPQPSGLFRRAVADPAVSLAKGVVGLGEATVGLLDLPTLGHAGKALEEHAGYDPRRTQEFLEGLYSPEQQAANRAVGEAKGVGGTLSALAENPSVIPHKLVETLPLLGGGGAIARALPAGMSALARGAAGEGTLAAGSSAEHVRQASETGTLSPEQTALAATSGAVTGLITRGSGALANRLGIGDVEQLLAGGGPAAATGKGRVRRGVEGALTEGLLEEAPQSAQEQALQNLALDKPVLEGVPEAGTLGGVIGSVLGGGVAALPGTQPIGLPAPATGSGAPGAVPEGDAGATPGAAGPPPSPPPSQGGGPPSSSPPLEGGVGGGPDVGLADLDPEQQRHMEAIRGQGPLTAAAVASGLPSFTPAVGAGRRPVMTSDGAPESTEEVISRIENSGRTLRLRQDEMATRQIAQQGYVGFGSREAAGEFQLLHPDYKWQKYANGEIRFFPPEQPAPSAPQEGLPAPAKGSTTPGRRSRAPLSPLGAQQAERARADIAAEQVRTAELAKRGPLGRAVFLGAESGSLPGAVSFGAPPSMATPTAKGASLGVAEDLNDSSRQAASPPPSSPFARGRLGGGPAAANATPAPNDTKGMTPQGLNAPRTEAAARKFVTGLGARFPDERFEVIPHAKAPKRFAIRRAGALPPVVGPGQGPDGQAQKGLESQGTAASGQGQAPTALELGEESPGLDLAADQAATSPKNKVVLGAASREEAERVYDAAFSDGSGAARRQAVSELPMEGFKAWLKQGDTKKPIAGQKFTSATPVTPPTATTPTDTPTQPASASPGASQEAAFSPEAHWNGLAPQERLALGQRAGWAKPFAQGFAKQPWAKLSPAARNVIARNITADASAALAIGSPTPPPSPSRGEGEEGAAPAELSSLSLGTRLRDPELQAALRHMATQAGWAQRGGEMLRDAQDQVTGRTQWLPNEPWYAAIPERLDREATVKAVTKALAGKKLGSKEERVLGYMLDAFERERQEGQLSPEEPDLQGRRAFREVQDDREVQSVQPREEANLQGRRAVHEVQDEDEAGREAREEREAIMAEADSALDALSDADIDALIGGEWTPFDGQVRLRDDEIRRFFDGDTAQRGRGAEQADGRRQVGAATEAGREARIDGERPLLEGYSAADLAEREQARLDAERREAEKTAAAQRKREADRAREGFVLTGSDNVADELEARGQGWLLDELAQKRQPERRTDAARRKRIGDMSREEIERELLTSALIGLHNRRAYDEAERLPIQVSIDADSLKWVNDNLGHGSGDKLLAAIGEAIGAETAEGYHFSGDEFVVQAETEKAALGIMTAVNARLEAAVITAELPDGSRITLNGLGVSYGIGSTLEQADRGLAEHKGERAAAGLRAARGERPPQAAKTAPERKPDPAGEVAAEEGVVSAEAPKVGRGAGKAQITKSKPVVEVNYPRGGDSGVRYSYVGKAAQLADRGALGEAIATSRPDSVLNMGRPVEAVPMEEIRKRTGWFKGKDDQWRFEISDKDAKLKPGWREAKRLGDAFEHPLLYANYPALNGVKFRVMELGPKIMAEAYPKGGTIFLSEKLSAEEARSALLHEIQHLVQGIERFAMGGNTRSEAVEKAALESYQKESERLTKRLDKLQDLRESWIAKVVADGAYPNQRQAMWAHDMKFPDAVLAVQKILRKIDRLEGSARLQAYERLMGEVEGRDVQARADMTDEERRGSAPYVSQGIKEEDFLIDFTGEAAALEEGGPPPNLPRSEQGRRTRNQKPGPAGLSASGLEETLVARFGGGVRRLIKAKTLRIVQHELELPPRLNDGKGGIRGVYDPRTDKTWMVSDNLTAAEAAGVFLHELGVHYGLERMVGSEKYEDIIEQMKAIEEDGKEALRLARAAIPAGTPDGAMVDDELLTHLVQKHPELPLVKRIIAAEAVRAARAAIPKGTRKTAVDDELLAYLVEKHPELPFVKRLIAAIRAFLFRMGLIKNVKPEDVVALAKAAARHAARTPSYLRLTPTLPPPSQGGGEEGVAPAYSGSPLWYSEMAKFLDDKAPGKAPAAQWKMLLANWAKQGKFKGDELEWSGVKEWLDLQQGPVTKDQVLGFVRENGVRVEETTLGESAQLLDARKKLRLAIAREASNYPDTALGRNSAADIIENAEIEARDHDSSKMAKQKWYAPIANELKALFAAAKESMGTGDTKHAQWQLPGGENYREVLLTLPEKPRTPGRIPPFEEWQKEQPYHSGSYEQRRVYQQWVERESKTVEPGFRSSHFGEPNILAHVRFNERTDADGNRVLFIEEIQSDWGQSTRRRGTPTMPEPELTRGHLEWTARVNLPDPAEGLIGYGPTRGDAIAAVRDVWEKKYGSPPAAPFVGKTEAWVALALKRMIRHAAENGFDRIAWTTGEQQAERYDLSKQVAGIEWNENGDLWAYPLEESGADSAQSIARGVSSAEVEKYVGKEVAERVRQAKPDGNGSRVLEGADLKVGGEGMRAFYDKIVPNVANGLLKKLGGGSVQTFTLKLDNAPESVVAETARRDPEHPFVKKNRSRQPGFDLTPELRASAMRGLPLFSRAAQTDTPAFRAWFGDSVVTDNGKPMKKGGKPLVVYHGTRADISTFRIGRDEAIYFTDSADQVKSATGNVGTFDPANPDIRYSRAGPPPTPPSQGGEQRGGAPPDPNTPEGAAAALGRIGEAMRTTRHGWEAVKSKIVNDWRPARLALATRRQLVDIGQGMVPELADYDRAVQAMDADRNQLDGETHEVAEIAEAYVQAKPKEADDFFDLLHAATLAGVDPADPFRPSINRGEAFREMASLRRRMRTRPGEANVLQGQIDEIQVRLGNEKVRKSAHPGLARRWFGLSQDAKVVYSKMRDLYKKRFDEREAALILRIRDTEADERWKARLIADIKHRFETARLSAPYFPLTRFGDFWVAAMNPDGEREFHLRESAHQMKALTEDLARAGYHDIASGRKIDTLFEQQGASAEFVTEVIKLLDRGTHISHEARADLKDAIYQIYLHSLPELSTRRHWIHRKKTPGFSRDAVRGFAKHMFHGNRQLAVLRQQTPMEKALAAARKREKYGADPAHEPMEQALRDMRKVKKDKADPQLVALEKALAAARKSVKDRLDPVRTADLINEMQKRDRWIKNPQVSSFAYRAGSLGFLWYLTAPASAIVNVTQTPLVAYPLMAARHGWVKSAAALNRAAVDFFRGRFSVEGALQGEELAAYRRFLADAVIDKTQTHDLAGMAETPSGSYSGRGAKAMRAASFMFHRAEVMNREITALAAYRLARADGLAIEAAYQQAKTLTFESHFDYSTGNKPRFLQNDAARVFLMFKQFSQHMLYLLGRSAHQSVKGLTPLARTEARTRLTGLLGMHALFAGALGMPLMDTLATVMNALFDDEDEPWDFETEFRSFFAEAFGPEVGQAIARGPVESLTGLGIASRVGLSDLVFREPDKSLEGRGWVEHWTEQLLGPLGGIALKAGTAYDLFQEGHTMRALESMTPTAIRSGLQMLRYAGEGAQSLRGDEVMEDVSTWNLFWQATGFSPAELGQKYDANRALKDLEQRILDRRERLIGRWWLARRHGDLEGVQEAMAEIGRFNGSSTIRQNPRARITPATLLASMQQRRNYSRRAEGGIIVDRRLSRLGERVRFGSPPPPP